MSAFPRGLEPPRRAALVVHEWQRAMIDPEMSTNRGLADHAETRQATARIDALATAMRDIGAPVIWSTIEPRPDRQGSATPCLLLSLLRRGGLTCDSPEAQLDPRLYTADSDIWIRRVHGLTPFHNTELEPYLRDARIDTVILAGVSTDVGIPGAALEAVNRGFAVVVAEDCIAGSSAEAHDWQVRNTIPLLAAVSDSRAIAEALRAGISADQPTL